jgi:putative SOS response-associated peptidase YedK
MCARYTLVLDLATILKRFLITGPHPGLTPRYNIAPTQLAPVILDGGTRSLDQFRWGLIPSWAKDPTIGHKLINARAETLAEKASFKRPFQRSRCLVPADGFYEWQAKGKVKIPMRIRLKSQEPFALAGLWDTWKDAEGKELKTFTIITTEPNEVLAPIHNRMPVIFRPQDEAMWLDPTAEIKHLTDALKPYPAEEMEAYEVSRVVNSAKNNVPQCIEPVTPGSSQSLFESKE